VHVCLLAEPCSVFTKMSDWNERYRRGEHTNDDPHPLVVKVASRLAPGRALDVACGAGRHAIWLAQRGWNVTAVDYSDTAIEILRERSRQHGVAVDPHIADLERHEFVIESAKYDLIVVCNYLQRDLFASIKEGTRIGGIVIAVIAMVDDDPNVKPMNPAFLLNAGELRANFQGWTVLHDFEGRPPGKQPRRAVAEIVACRSR
jgi:tellurite methyltransferase